MYKRVAAAFPVAYKKMTHPDGYFNSYGSWQPESWWLFTGSDILVDQARKEWELLDKGFYTVAAELTNKFGKKFYKFI